MAKKKAEAKPAPKSEDKFVDLMLLAADYAKSAGGIEAAKRSLSESAAFIASAGGADSAAKALEVLENLKAKIGG